MTCLLRYKHDTFRCYIPFTFLSGKFITNNCVHINNVQPTCSAGKPFIYQALDFVFFINLNLSHSYIILAGLKIFHRLLINPVSEILNILLKILWFLPTKTYQ